MVRTFFRRRIKEEGVCGGGVYSGEKNYHAGMYRDVRSISMMC